MTPDQVARARGTRYDPGFWNQARCKGRNPADFFREDNEGMDRAKGVCASCPVRESCACYAIATRCDGGVWGGMSTSQRLRVHGKLKRVIVEQYGYAALFG